MKKQFTFIWILLAFCLYASILKAQVAKTEVVRVMAKANANGSITLSWPAETYSGNFEVYRRENLLADWGSNPLAVVPGNNNTYTDITVTAGNAYEYMLIKRNTSIDALGYIYAGSKYPEQRNYQHILLLVDSNYKAPLSAEIDRLQQDLMREGWKVSLVYARRNDSVPLVRARIKSVYDQAQIPLSTLFIVGHVPVPYSGYYSSNGEAPPPDGHIEGSGNHTGAWPADVYYGLLFYPFTDENVNCTTGSQNRLYNIPGDGKFDQTKVPSNPELEVGRVDFFNMPQINANDTTLMRNYLNRNHAFKTGSWHVSERAVIDNNFGSFNLASTAYSNFASLVGNDSVYDNRDYFTAQKQAGYLWSYGCGAGSFTSCSGVGNTLSFANDSFENVFTILCGSFFGDWDVQNNFLRAPLCTKSLASFWGGIPKWYVHHMGIGHRIGYGTRITQNNTTFYYSGNFNGSSNSMHIALMGDPSLKMRYLPEVTGLTAVSQNKKVVLNWNSVNAPGIGYGIYRLLPQTQEWVRLNATLITDTFFTDDKNYYTGTYTYMIKAIREENNASGSYINSGLGALGTVNHVNGVNSLLAETEVSMYPNPLRAGNNLVLQLPENILAESISLLTAEGRVLWQQTGLNETQLNCKVNEPAGLYLIQVKTAEGVWTGRLIIQ